MAIALVANAIAVSSDGEADAVTSAINTTGANLLVVMIGHYDEGRGPVTLSDSKTNTWTPITSYGVGGTNQKIIGFYVASPTVGSGHTFTAHTESGLTYHAICVAAFSGAHATPYDTINGNSSSGAASLAPGSITPSEDNCLVVSGVNYDSASTGSVDSGMTVTDKVENGAGNQATGMAYKIQTTAAAINPTWSWTGSVSCATNNISFKAAAGGGGFTGASMYRWNGSAWVAPGLLKYWSGSAWVQKVMKIWK